MREERLLERLGATLREPLRRERVHQGRLVDSLLVHLRCMLNTRQGSVPIAPDYGIPDFLDFLQNFPDSVRQIEESIREVIVRYEPRLETVTVKFLPQDEDLLSLRFQIHARVRDGSGANVCFQTLVGTDGKISVCR